MIALMAFFALWLSHTGLWPPCLQVWIKPQDRPLDHLQVLSQPMANLTKPWGITYLGGEIGGLSFYFMVLWLSEVRSHNSTYRGGITAGKPIDFRPFTVAPFLSIHNL